MVVHAEVEFFFFFFKADCTPEHPAPQIPAVLMCHFSSCRVFVWTDVVGWDILLVPGQ